MYHSSGNSWGQLYTQLCVLVSETPIGEVLDGVEEASCEPFYQRYLYDFVRSVYKCNHRKPEYAEMEYGVDMDLHVYAANVAVAII